MPAKISSFKVIVEDCEQCGELDGEVILQITAIGPTGNVPVTLKTP